MLNKTIGLVGGIPPKCVKSYFNKLNQNVKEEFGENHSAKIIIKALNYATISKLRAEKRIDELKQLFIDSVNNLEKAGVDIVMFTTNTVNFALDESVTSKINLPVIDLFEEITNSIISNKYKKITVLGSRFVMQNKLFTDAFKKKGIQLILPSQEDIEFIDNNIFKEITFGIVTPEARNRYIGIINNLIQKENIEAVVLANPSFATTSMLTQNHINIPLIDSVDVNVKTALKFAKK